MQCGSEQRGLEYPLKKKKKIQMTIGIRFTEKGIYINIF